MVVEIILKNGPSETYEISKERVIVGRKSECDITINNKMISREHLEIIVKEGKISIRDITASNWVSCNKEKLSKIVPTLYMEDTELLLPADYIVKIYSEHSERSFEIELENDFDNEMTREKKSQAPKKEKIKKVTPKKESVEKIHLEVRKQTPHGLRTGRRPQETVEETMSPKGQNKLIYAGAGIVVILLMVYFLG